MKMAYLARPLDNQQVDPAAVNQTVRILADLGVVVYDPGYAWTMSDVPASGPVCAAVQSVNEAALLAADLVVALIPSPLRSVGVPAELALAMNWGKQVLMVLLDPDAVQPSLMLRGWAHILAEQHLGGFTLLDRLNPDVRLLDAAH